MAEKNEKPKRQGHPPWTEAQKQARRELIARRKEEMARLEGEELEEFIKTRKMGRKPWTEADHEKMAATWARKREKLDEERKALIAANPTKSKKELGIHEHWKPADGSDSGYRRTRLREARIGISLPPINIENEKEVEQRINDYFDFCESADKTPNQAGIANWLGISKNTLYAWYTGAKRSTTHTPIIQRAFSVMEEILVDSVQSAKKADIGGMFVLKTTFGYKEEREIVLQSGDGRKEMSSSDIEKWFLDDGKTVETTFSDDGQKEGD